jgi:hypothetical protein
VHADSTVVPVAGGRTAILRRTLENGDRIVDLASGAISDVLPMRFLPVPCAPLLVGLAPFANEVPSHAEVADEHGTPLDRFVFGGAVQDDPIASSVGPTPQISLARARHTLAAVVAYPPEPDRKAYEPTDRVEIWDLTPAPARRRAVIPNPFPYAVGVDLRADAERVLVTGCRDTAPLSSCDFAIFDARTGARVPAKAAPKEESYVHWDDASQAIWVGVLPRRLWDPASGAIADEKNAEAVVAVRTRARAPAAPAPDGDAGTCAPAPNLVTSARGIENVVGTGRDAERELVVPMFAVLEPGALHASPRGDAVLLDEVFQGRGPREPRQDAIVVLDPPRMPPPLFVQVPQGNEPGWQWIDRAFATVRHEGTTGAAPETCTLMRHAYDGDAGAETRGPCGPYSSDGALVVTWNDKSVSVGRAVDPKPLCTVFPVPLVEKAYGPVPADSYRSVAVAKAALSQDGESLYVGVYGDWPRGGGGHVLRYDTKRCAKTWGPVDIGLGGVFDWVVSADGEIHLEGGIVTATGEADISVRGGARSDFAPGQAGAAYAIPKGVLVRQGGAWHHFTSPALDGDKEPSAVGTSADGRFAAAANDTTLVVWSTADGAVVATLPSEPGAHALLLLHDARVVILATGDDVTWIRTTPGEPAAPTRLHLRAFVRSGAAPPSTPRYLVEADGRADGDPDLLAVATPRSGAPVPRAPGLFAAWMAQNDR